MNEGDMAAAAGILCGLGGLVLIFGDTPLEQLLRAAVRVTIGQLERGQDRRLDGKLTALEPLKGLVSGRAVVFQQVICYRWEQQMGGDRKFVESSRSVEWAIDLTLDDGTGRVQLDPTEGEYHLQRVFRVSKASLKLWPPGAPPDADQVEEWSIADGEPVTVIGNARGSAEQLVVGGKRGFVLTNSTAAELKAHHRNMRLVGALMVAGGFGVALLSVLARF
jgi:hypothetical protein